MIDREAVASYDRFWQSTCPPLPPTREIPTGLWTRARVLVPSGRVPTDAERRDVVIAGAGPWGLLLGSLLARRGHGVLVLERNPRLRCGATWNLSRPEFEDLRRTRALADEAWDGLVTGEFIEGVFRLHDEQGPVSRQRQYHFDEILNISLDEERFLGLLAATPGLEVRTGASARLAGITPGAALARFEEDGVPRTVAARLFIDASGWTSPLAGLMTRNLEPESVYNMLGIRTNVRLPRIVNPETGRPMGLVCATFENEIPSGGAMVQPVLERFTDFRPGGTDSGDIIYFFTRTARPVPLSPLIDDMVARIPQAVEGFREEHVVRTYFGHAPAYFRPSPFARHRRRTSVGDRTLLVGLAALQYSGLTACAFGPLSRNAAALVDAIDRALRRNRLSFRDLCRIDIDPRERVSQDVEELFGGALELAPGEPQGTVNRDWISFAEAAEGLDPHLKNEAFRDKIRLATLDQLVAVCARRPDTIAAVLRNNRGHLRAVVWTIVSAYCVLLYHELRLLFAKRDRKYAAAGSRAMAALPAFATNVCRVYATGRRIGSRLRTQ